MGRPDAPTAARRGAPREFDFPPGIAVGATPDEDTYVVDAGNQVRIAGYNAKRLAGPPRPPRTGLLRRLLGP